MPTSGRNSPRSAIVGLVSIVVLGLAAPALANDWASLGLDAGRRRASDERSGAPFSVAWNASPSAGAFVASPAVVDGLVVVAGAQGNVTALNAVDGSEAWTMKAAGAIGASPVVERGRVYLPTLSGQLGALHLGTGAAAWWRPFGGQNYGSPGIVSDGLGVSVVLAAGFPQQKVVRLSASTGTTQWETPRGAVADLVTSSPAFGAGQITFGMNGGRYQTLDVLTGATTWRSDVAGVVGLSAPLVVGTTAYFLPGGDGVALYAADAATGRLLPGWPVQVADASAPAPSAFGSSRRAVSSPALFGDLVVFVTRFEYDLVPALRGAQGSHTLREYVVAVDPKAAVVAWQQELGHRDAPTSNDIPELNVTPTPLSFATDTSPLVAVASSIVPVVQVYDIGGQRVWSASLSAPTRSSPAFANGLLIVATDLGVVHAFSSDVNHAPLAPTTGFDPADGQMVDEPAPTLRWAAALDDEGQPLRYQVRVLGSSDDLYESPLAQLDVAAGETSVVVTQHLTPGASYRYAVRSRDASGAWSSWSSLHAFVMTTPATIDVAGKPFDTIDDAVASLPPAGGTITLGRGALRLTSSLRLPAGVSLVGASPHDTIINAAGLPAGVQMRAAARPGASTLSNLTVTGADVGVDVVDAPSAVVRNVVVRDNRKAGLEVEEGASAEAVNVTLARNGTGAEVSGTLSIHSSIVVQNGTGLARAGQGVLTSRYNDVFANATESYRAATAGTGDISVAVTFRSPEDFHLAGLQLTTDEGDPSDGYGLEPQPNGARVNLGAFGNTPTAELSGAVGGWTPVASTRPGVSAAAPSPVPQGDPSAASGARGATPSDHAGVGAAAGCAVEGGNARSGQSYGWLLLVIGTVSTARRRAAPTARRRNAVSAPPGP